MVGYRDPPKDTQFKPEHSGNPAGRRRRIDSFENDLLEALSAETSVFEKGVERKLSKQQALIHALITAAIDGNVGAAAAVLALIPRPAALPAESTKEPLSDADPELVKSLDRRQRRLRDNVNSAKSPKGSEQP